MTSLYLLNMSKWKAKVVRTKIGASILIKFAKDNTLVLYDNKCNNQLL